MLTKQIVFKYQQLDKMAEKPTRENTMISSVIRYLLPNTNKIYYELVSHIIIVEFTF